MDRFGWALGALGLGLGLTWGFGRGMRPKISLDGKVVLITGGSRGLGLALARELGSRGAKVAICGRNERSLSRAREDLRQRGVRVLVVQGDLSRREEAVSVVRRVRATLGPIDVLVNNAGQIQVGPHDSMTEEDHETSLDLYYWAPLRLMEEVLPEMKARKHGHIVNISSIGGRIAVPHMIPYSAGKHALTGLSRGMRAELGRYGITVLTVFPGLMNTGSPKNAAFKGRHKEEYAWFSLVDRAPGIAMNAARAARGIRRAIESNRTEKILGAHAHLAIALHDLAPSLSYAVIAGAERFLPDPNGQVHAHRGWDSRSRLSKRAPFVGRLRRAARDLNQESAS